MVCNADEGEPGAYMDRTVLEGDPHAVLEGMLIGSYAIGASEGFIYVRSEYPLAIEILEHAIDEAEKRGLLGDDILGSGWSFRVTVRRGAGAYICGEETALIESLEGHAGEPRTRPPYPVTSGLWGKPTVVNNVKTWASVAPILTRGAAWYAAMGTKRTPGTTIFSLEGAVKNAGLVEVPFGITLRELVYEIGGGLVGDRPLKALQAGGASRGCIPPVHARPGHRHRRPRRRDDHDRHRRDHRAGRHAPAWSTWPGSWSASSSKSRAASASPAARGPSRCTAS